jgi:hypothetical protein
VTLIIMVPLMESDSSFLAALFFLT